MLALPLCARFSRRSCGESADCRGMLLVVRLAARNRFPVLVMNQQATSGRRLSAADVMRQMIDCVRSETAEVVETCQWHRSASGFWIADDLTLKMALEYDVEQDSFLTIILLKEGWDVAGDALKVEDATWDTDVMKATELVMVDFWAVWCGPCQMVAPIVEELAKEYAGKLKVRKLNTDENPEVAGRYQVMSIPTILFFKNGQPVEKLVGARPKRQFKEMIDSLLAQHAGTA